MELVKERHPLWSDSLIEEIARVEFETAAQQFIEGTLLLAQKLRPKSAWGLYGFPNCYNDNDAKPYTCSKQTMQMNDQLWWMFESSSALFPSIYLYNDKSRNNTLFVKYRLLEGFRHSKKLDGHFIPVYPYVRITYPDSQLYLNEVSNTPFLLFLFFFLLPTKISRIQKWKYYVEDLEDESDFNVFTSVTLCRGIYYFPLRAFLEGERGSSEGALAFPIFGFFWSEYRCGIFVKMRDRALTLIYQFVILNFEDSFSGKSMKVVFGKLQKYLLKRRVIGRLFAFCRIRKSIRLNSLHFMYLSVFIWGDGREEWISLYFISRTYPG